MRLVVMALPGGLGSGIQGFVDIFAIARECLALGGVVPTTDLDVVLCTPEGRPVLDGMGRQHGPGVALKDVGACDAVFVPGLMIGREMRLPDLAPLESAVEFVRSAHAHGAIVASSCSGALILAAAGLLDGRHCTASWWMIDALRALTPRAKLAVGAALVEDGRVITGGGPFSWISVALRALRLRLGADAARMIANFTVVDTAPISQVPFMPAALGAPGEAFAAEAEAVLRRRRGESVDADDLARALHVSVRTLQRRIKNISGETPRDFIERIRMDDARAELELGSASLARIAANAGYADEPSFRRAFKRRTGMTPGAYRRWLETR